MRKLVSDHKQANGSAPGDLCVMATGGGAYKYYDRITKALGVEVIREDEMESLITGAATRRFLIDKALTSARRPRLLHQRDTRRGLYVQRRHSHGLCAAPS